MSRSRSLYLILTLVMIAVLSVVFVACNIDTGDSCEHEYSYEIKQLPTMDAEGSMTVKCSKCELNEEIIIPSLSDMSTWSWKVESKQSLSCEQGGIVVYTSVRPYGGIVVEINTEARGHILSELVAEVSSTCTVHGVKAHKECSECGKYFDADGNEITSLELPLADHKIGELIAEVPSTCISHGVKAHKECSECGKLFDKDGKAVESLELPLVGHNFGDLVEKKDSTCSVAGTKAHYVCSVCGVCYDENKENKLDDLIIPVKAHEYDEGTVIFDPTCYSLGIKEFKCNNCDHPYYEDIAMVAHVPEKLDGFAATCWSKGLTDGEYCSVCGEIFNAQQEISALEHKYELTETIDATCISEGYKNFTCSLCGDVKVETIEKIDHTPEKLEGYDATCTEPGLSDGLICSYCGTITQKQEVISAKGHTKDNGVIDSEPTCTEVGSKLYTCEHCDETWVEEIPAKGHEHVKVEGIPATCTVSGLSDGEECFVCGEILVAQTVVPALGHDWDEGEILVQVTCTHRGEISHECSRCDASYIEYIKATGHSYSEAWSYDGTNHFHKCENCDAVSDKASHKDNNKDHKCDVCGYTMSSCVDRDKNHSCDSCGASMGTHVQAPGKHTCDYCGQVMSAHEGGTATCKESATCTVCGQKYGSKDPANHVGHIIWVTDDTYHQQKYDCCNLHLGAKELHDLNENNVCTVCGHGCKHSDTVHTEGLGPTCTEEGHIEYWTCDHCSTIFSDEACTQPVANVVIPAKGHSLGSLVSAKEPNCTEAGYHAYYQCSACSVYFDANRKETTWADLEIETLGHNSDGVIAHKDANCTESGVVGGTYCTRCNDGKAAAETVINALGHSYGDWIAEIPASCTEEGTLGHYHCSECSIDFDSNKAILTNLVINKVNHTPAEAVRENEQDANCTEKGHYDSVVYCSVCGDELSKESNIEIPAKGHSYGDWIDEIPATCRKPGVEGHKDCSVCKKHFDIDGNEIPDLSIAIDSNAHVWSDAWSVDETYHWHSCANCGAKNESAEHSFGKDGKCTVCHAEKIYLVNGSNYITSTEYTYTNNKTGASKVELKVSSKKDEAVKLIKRENADGFVTFITFDGKYLYTNGTDVKFVDSEGEYTLFELEVTDGGYLIKSANVVVYNNPQYLEIYSGYLTVYKLDSSKLKYTFKLENVDHICSTPVRTEAKDATCTEAGNREYWTCPCGKIYSDEACTNEIALADTVISALGHKDEDNNGKCDECGYTIPSVDTKQYFVKVTNISQLKNGSKILIVYEDDALAFDGSLSGLDAINNNTPVTISDGKISNSNLDKYTFAISITDAGYTIKSNDGYYIGRSSDSNGLDSNKSKSYINSISVNTDGSVDIVSGGAYLRYNAAKDQKRYRYFSSKTYTKQKPIAIYLLDSSSSGGDETHTHSITKTDAKDATCTEVGNIACWYCSVCEKYFIDEACTTELTDVNKDGKVDAKDAEIAALGHTYGINKDLEGSIAGYIWNADYTECVANGICSRCDDTTTVESISVTINDLDSTPATCKEYSKTVYVAEFDDEASWYCGQRNIVTGTTLADHDYDSYDICKVCQEKDPSKVFYLIGYIDGNDYGCESDGANLGDYEFANGSVEVKFTNNSYVFVKAKTNSAWYMTDGWLGTDVQSAILYNTNKGLSNANKLFVPGNSVVTFTLTYDRENDTIKLSYTWFCQTHNWNDATCTAPKTCSVCGAIEGTALGHSVGEWIEAAGTCQSAAVIGHYECKTCGVNLASDKQTVITIIKDDKDPDNHEGTPSTEWQKDASGHWHVYSCCGVKTNEAAHTPDHEGSATEEYAIKCKDCDYVIEAQKNHEHTYGEAKYFTNENQSLFWAIRTCASCNADAEGHTEEAFGTLEDIYSNHPLCEEEGYILAWVDFEADWVEPNGEYGCCRFTIPAVGHSPSYHKETAAKYNEPGNNEYWICSRCKKYFSDAECTKEITDKDSVIIPALNRVYFTNTIGWENVYIYAWVNGGSDTTGWSDHTMIKGSDNQYYYDLESKYDMVIFHNNSGTQTGDLDLVNEKVYEPFKAIHYYNYNNWENIYVHHWVDDGYSCAWGTCPAMSADGDGWYTIYIRKECQKVIFKNSSGDESKQTDGIVIDWDAPYYFYGSWVNSKAPTVSVSVNGSVIDSTEYSLSYQYEDGGLQYNVKKLSLNFGDKVVITDYRNASYSYDSGCGFSGTVSRSGSYDFYVKAAKDTIGVSVPAIEYTLNGTELFVVNPENSNELKAAMELNKGASLIVKDNENNTYSDWGNSGFLSDDNTVIHSGNYTIYLKLDSKKIYVDAPGHSYGTEVDYVWTDESACVAKRTCECGDVDECQATISNKVTQSATCSRVEKTTYTADFTVDWATTQTKDKQTAGKDANAHTEEPTWVSDSASGHHQYYSCCKKSTTTVNHDWSNNNGVCKDCEYRCEHTGNQTLTSVSETQHQNKCDTCHALTGEASAHDLDDHGICNDKCGYGCDHNWNSATCTEPQTCSKCGSKVGEALGHTYGIVSYNWRDDNTDCIATRTCSVCAEGTEGHTQTATATVESTLIKAQSCVNAAIYDYEAEFTVDWAETQTKENVENGSALGHDEVNQSAKAATCTEVGWDAYVTCSRCDYTTKIEIPALGHKGSKTEAKDATCTEAGNIDYWTCTNAGCGKIFSDEACTTELTDVNKDGKVDANDAEIAALGHTYGIVSYNWRDDNTDCKATRTCSVCAEGTEGHTQTATATANSTQKQAQSCVNAAIYDYEAEFTVDWAETQTKENVENGSALGHDEVNQSAKAATCTEVGWDAYVTCSRCDYTTKIEIPALGHKGSKTEAKDATCTEVGNIACWYCSVCEKYFIDEACTTELTDVNKDGKVDAKDAEIAALGHTYGIVSYNWRDDNTDCKATRTCSVCAEGTEGHTQTATATVESTLIKAQSCVNAAIYDYEAKFTFDWAETQIKENVENGSALGHAWDSDWHYDETTSGHYHICTREGCVEHSTSVDHADINKDHNCDDCGYVISSCADDNNDHNCDYCGKEGITNHSYTAETDSETYLKSSATCENNAVYYKSCSICGASSKDTDYEATFEKENSKLGHSYTAETDSETYLKSSATCENNAVYYKSCSICGASSKDTDYEDTFEKENSKLGHSYTAETASDDRKASSATCTAKATYYYSCSVCGVSENNDNHVFESGEYAAHNYGEWSSNNDGTHSRTCSYNSTHIETFDCSGGSATCTVQATCSVCSQPYGVLAAHNYVAVEGVSNLYECSYCNKEFKASSTSTWELLTDVSKLSVGSEIIIVAKDYDYALSTTQNTNNRGTVAVNKNDNSITFVEGIQVITIASGNIVGTFALKVESSYLYAASSNKNHLKTEGTLSDNSSWSISVTNGVATIEAQGTNTHKFLKFNNTNILFSCYASGQSDVVIYICSTSTSYTEIESHTCSEHVENATCTADGVCSICERTVEGTKVNHTISDVWSKDSTTHYHTCTICKTKLDSTDHTYGDDGICTVCSFAKPETGGSDSGSGTETVKTTVNLSENFDTYAKSWTSYSTRTVSSRDLGVYDVSFNVEFEKTMKQTQTICDVPVMKPESSGNYITIKPTDATISSVSFSFKEWGASKTFSKIWIQYTLDGSTWNDSICGGYNDSAKSLTDIFGNNDKTVTASELPEGVKAVRLFVKGENQIGIAGFSITTTATTESES